jgi:N-acetylmuramic acid 6-phosphate etherase
VGETKHIETGHLSTEQRNPRTMDLDKLSPVELVEALQAENRLVAAAVDAALPEIARAVEQIAERMARGGRLLYFGAGTSGRLGVLDASECPPTFGVPPDLVVGIIAGGDTALRTSIEGAEDDPEASARDVAAQTVSALDTVVGIAASGRTPYVLGALQEGSKHGALTIAVTNVLNSEASRLADITLCADTGPEALTGSTRLKAGTAQKLILNILSTGVMTLLGKTYSNLMVDVQATNAKLRDRAIRIVCAAAEVNKEVASDALERTGWSVKPAIAMVKTGLPGSDVKASLARRGGRLRYMLEEVEGS